MRCRPHRSITGPQITQEPAEAAPVAGTGPPCRCGTASVLLTVRKEGPNKDRQFYGCVGACRGVRATGALIVGPGPVSTKLGHTLMTVSPFRPNSGKLRPSKSRIWADFGQIIVSQICLLRPNLNRLWRNSSRCRPRLASSGQFRSNLGRLASYSACAVSV